MLANYIILVVGKEYIDLIIDEWDKDKEEQKRKSDLKREKMFLIN